MKRLRIALMGLWLAGFGVYQVTSHAAGFDCAKAKAPVESLICRDGELSHLDEQLGAVYAATTRRCPAGEVKEAQQRWLREIRNDCLDEACLAAVYRKRLLDLQNWQCSQSRCAGYAQRLPGAWKMVSELGAFEEIAFEKGQTEGRGRFDTWLHSRPELVDGQWQIQGCRLLLLYPGETDDGSAAGMTIKSLDGDRLEILDNGEAQPAVYRRMGN